MNGSRSDKALYNMSSLKETIERGGWLNGPKVLLRGIPMKEIVLADSGFTNNRALISPFDMQNVTYALSEKQINYNLRLSRVRVRVENSIGYLKNRFTILKRKNHYNPVKMSKVFLVCCIL